VKKKLCVNFVQEYIYRSEQALSFYLHLSRPSELKNRQGRGRDHVSILPWRSTEIAVRSKQTRSLPCPTKNLCERTDLSGGIGTRLRVDASFVRNRKLAQIFSRRNHALTKSITSLLEFNSRKREKDYDESC